MKFSAAKNILLKTIQITQTAINTKTSLPILSNILIEARDEDTIFTATDLDLGIISMMPVKPTTTGSITIPAKKFFDIIKELPESEVLISVKKNNLIHIECEKTAYKIMGLPKDEFPQLPEFKNKDYITLQQKILKTMLEQTAFAMSHDEARYVLNGVLVLIRPSSIRIVSTDGRRLAMSEHKAQFPKTMEKKTIVPAKTILELIRVLTDEGDIKLSFGDNQAAFEAGPTKIVSRLIEGEFPDYEQVIPKEVKDKVKAPREKLLAALKRVAILTSQDSKAIKIELTKDKMVLSKASHYFGEAREEIEVDYKGKDLAAGFNPDYLIDALKNINQETIALELQDAEKPAVIRFGDEYVYVVLPMQIS